jgi:hypothetical protein
MLALQKQTDAEQTLLRKRQQRILLQPYKNGECVFVLYPQRDTRQTKALVIIGIWSF